MSIQQTNPMHTQCRACKGMTEAIFSFVPTKWLMPCHEFAVLCADCAKTHEIRVEPIDPGPTDQQEA